MSGSYLIYGSNKTAASNAIEKLVSDVSGKDFSLRENIDPDIQIIGTDAGKNIGISEVEQGLIFLHEKPYAADYKILIVLHAEKVQKRAQNLFLKVLEEPPTYATIILASRTLQEVLETVQSRCRKISIYGKKEEQDSLPDNIQINNISYSKLLGLTVEEKLIWSEELSKEEKEDIINVLETLLEQGRGELLKSDPVVTAHNLQLINEFVEDLRSINVNTRLAVESLVLRLES